MANIHEFGLQPGDTTFITESETLKPVQILAVFPPAESPIKSEIRDGSILISPAPFDRDKFAFNPVTGDLRPLTAVNAQIVYANATLHGKEIEVAQFSYNYSDFEPSIYTALRNYYLSAFRLLVKGLQEKIL